MQYKNRRSRARIAIVGALVGGLFSVGAMTESASAAKKAPPGNDPTIDVVVEIEITPMTFSSGIRW